MSRWLGIPAVALFATAVLAQQPETAHRPTPTRAGARTWSEPVSRDLFTACDRDGDDRLDLFEACEALDSLHDPKNSEGFGKIDTDRDGFLSWPEFDQHFWSVTRLGSTFFVKTCRQTDRAPEQREARAATNLQRFLSLHDRNADGALDPDEVEKMVVHTGLQPTVSAKLRGLDRDQSGRIDEAELAPWFESLRGLVPEAAATAAPAGSALLPPWHENDADRNGKIDQEELAATLRRLDPSLARWAPQLLKLLDADKDGTLGPDELPVTRRPLREGASTSSTTAPAATPGTDGKPAPTVAGAR